MGDMCTIVPRGPMESRESNALPLSYLYFTRDLESCGVTSGGFSHPVTGPGWAVPGAGTQQTHRLGEGSLVGAAHMCHFLFWLLAQKAFWKERRNGSGRWDLFPSSRAHTSHSQMIELQAAENRPSGEQRKLGVGAGLPLHPQRHPLRVRGCCVCPGSGQARSVGPARRDSALRRDGSTLSPSSTRPSSVPVGEAQRV